MVSRMLLNIWIVPSPSDLNQTQGLCGTYDGLWENEAHFRNGSRPQSQTQQTNKTARGQPNDFINDWRVDLFGPDSLLGGVPANTAEEVSKRYCLSDQFLHRKDCGYGMDVETCDIFHGIEITEQLIGMSTQPKTSDLRLRRDKEANSVLTQNNYADEPIIVDKKFVPPKHKWKPGWNEVHAKGHCERYLHENYTLGQLCAQIPGVNMETEVRTCMEDIQILGNDTWAESARDAMKEQCLEEIQRNGSLSRNLTDMIQDAMCPADCSQRGRCLQGVCQCDRGYTGADCSLAVNQPPYLSQMPRYGLCDLRYSACNRVFIYGNNFVDSKNLTCHLQECQVNAKTYIPGDTITKVMAKFINFGAVECLLPNVTSYLIYISNNGVNMSDALLFVPFDSQCQECSTNDTFCVKRKTSCIIDGKCYKEGEHSETNECLVCAASDRHHELEFTTSTDAHCQPSWWVSLKLPDWVIAVVAAVGGSLIGILVGFLLYKCCCKSKKHIPGSRPSLDSRDDPNLSPFEDAMLHRNRDLPAFASDRFSDLHLHQPQPQFEETFFFNDGRGVENGVDSTTYF